MVKRRGRKIVPFDRSRKRHRQWHLADPPGRKRARRRGGALKWAMIAVGTVLLGGPVLDAATGVVKPGSGCRILVLVDGDTVRGWCPGQGMRAIRLIGFDTPEYNSRCVSELIGAVAATYALRWTLLTAGRIDTELDGTDRYGRALGRVRVDGAPLAAAMIETGLARPYAGGVRASWCA